MNHKKKIRDKFRTLVFDRDKNICAKCGDKDSKLDAHHITDRKKMPNGGYVAENGISLCSRCHLNAEEWHCGKVIEGFTPDDLYAIISSSHEIAWEASLKLLRKK
jgi:5-methylcytosine-specific restriction endonuclease McrA